ncbi:hypothetical protein, partial [Fusobacterium necrophorum]
ASNPKAKSYWYHLGKSFDEIGNVSLHLLEAGDKFFSSDIKGAVGEGFAAINSLFKPASLGIGAKLGDEKGRVRKGSNQYGTKEEVEGKQEFIRRNTESVTDMVVTPIVIKSVGVGISKGKELVNSYKYNSYISNPNVSYDGVKKASKYLKDIDVNRVERKKIINSFVKETIRSEKAGLNQYGIRFYDIDYKIKTYPAYPEGQYLFETFTPYVNRENLALPPSWNQMTSIKQFQIKPETLMFKGKAGPQFLEGAHYIYPGGAPQIFIYRPDIYKTLLEIKY